MPPISRESYQAARRPNRNLDTPLNPISYDPWGKVNDRMDNLIDRSVGTGDVLEEEFRQVGPEFWDRHNRYQDLGDEAYGGLLTGDAGYSPDEMRDIQDRARLEGLDYTQDEYNDLFMTPDEQRAAVGNSFGVMDYYNPDLVRGQVHDFRDRGREALTEGGDRMRGALGGANLDIDPGFAGRARGAAGAYFNDANINEDALRLRDGFLDQYQLSDSDVRDMSDLGARTASARWDSAYDDTARRANAAGTMSPAAMAVLRERLDNRSNIDAADAATRARLEATGLQRDLLGQGETMRLGSEQYITDANLARAGRGADLRLSAEEGIEDRRYRGESEKLGRGLDIEDSLMRSRLGHETNVGDAATGVEQYLQNTGQGLYQGADDRSVDRNQFRATNRQGATQAGQQARRDYGFGVSDRVSGRTQTTGDARRQDENTGREYLRDQSQFNAGMYDSAANRRSDSAVGMTNAQLGGMSDRRQRRGPGIYERTLLGVGR